MSPFYLKFRIRIIYNLFPSNKVVFFIYIKIHKLKIIIKNDYIKLNTCKNLNKHNMIIEKIKI